MHSLHYEFVPVIAILLFALGSWIVTYIYFLFKRSIWSFTDLMWVVYWLCTRARDFKKIFSCILSHSKSNWYSSPTKRLMSVQAMRFSINSIYFHYLNCTEGNRSVIITPWAVNSQTNLCIKMFLSRGKKVLIQWPT